MNGKGLKPAETEATRAEGSPPRRRRGRKLQFLALLALFFIFVVPYPTRVFPPATIQVVDQNGKAIRGSRAEWRGITNASSIHGDAFFDERGVISLPHRKAWASAFRRILGDSGCLAKLQISRGELDFGLPAGYEVDLEASAITMTEGGAWCLPDSDDTVWQRHLNGGNAICVYLFNPTQKNVRNYRIVLRQESSSKRATTQDAQRR